VGQLYQSVGFDLVTDPAEEKLSVTDLTKTVEERLAKLHSEVFTEPRSAEVLTVEFGKVDGLDPERAALLTEGMNRVFSISHIQQGEAGKSNYRIDLNATLQPPRSGSQPARLGIQLIDVASGKERNAQEFKTTLSTPVDEEQLRTLGEGAAYRVLLTLPPGRGVRVGTRLPGTDKLTQSRTLSLPPPQAVPDVAGGVPPAATATADTARSAPPQAPVPLAVQTAGQPAASPALADTRSDPVAAPPASPPQTARLPVSLDGDPLDLNMESELHSLRRLSLSSAWLPDAEALIAGQIQNQGQTP
jgi:hypothetical protein